MEVKNTLQQLEDFFQNTITRMLGFDPVVIQDAVRISFASDGAPAWKRTEDKVFIQITQQDDPYNRLKEITYETIDSDNVLMVTQFTRVICLNIIFYGPNSFDKIDDIKNSFYNPSYSLLCKLSNIHILTDIKAPIRSPELFNGQWWDRSNIDIVFNEYVRLEQIIPSVEVANVQVPYSK